MVEILGQERADEMKAKSLESPMVEYHQEIHPDQEIWVTMEIVGHEPKPLHRKTLEGIRIWDHTGGIIMNRKGE